MPNAYIACCSAWLVYQILFRGRLTFQFKTLQHSTNFSYQIVRHVSINDDNVSWIFPRTSMDGFQRIPAAIWLIWSIFVICNTGNSFCQRSDFAARHRLCILKIWTLCAVAINVTSNKQLINIWYCLFVRLTLPMLVCLILVTDCRWL